MPFLTTDDGVKLHYEDVGSGTPIVFVHEYAGDCRIVGEPASLFRPALSLHRLQRPWLHALRGPGRPGNVFAGSGSRRHQVRPGCAEVRQGAHRRPVDGRFRHAAFRLYLSRARAVAGHCRMRLRRASRQASTVPRRTRRDRRAAFEATGMAKPPRAMRSARRACNSRTRIRAAGREFADQLATTRPRAGADHARRADAPPVALRTRRADEDRSRHRRWLSPATRTIRASSPAS